MSWQDATAYEEGYSSCANGLIEQDNPYQLDDSGYNWWRLGWQDANDGK